MNRGRRQDNAEHEPVTPEDLERARQFIAEKGETLEEGAEDE